MATVIYVSADVWRTYSETPKATRQRQPLPHFNAAPITFTAPIHEHHGKRMDRYTAEIAKRVADADNGYAAALERFMNGRRERIDHQRHRLEATFDQGA